MTQREKNEPKQQTHKPEPKAHPPAKDDEEEEEAAPELFPGPRPGLTKRSANFSETDSMTKKED